MRYSSDARLRLQASQHLQRTLYDIEISICVAHFYAVSEATGQTLLAALRQPRNLLITVDQSVPEITKRLRHVTTVALKSGSHGWKPSIERLLGTGPQICLVRPDGYIGFAGNSAEALREYAHEVGLF